MKYSLTLSIIITTLLILAGITSTILLIEKGSVFGLMPVDIISNIIQIWIGVGAFISAVFVIVSYLQTNKAFALSQMPHLLLYIGPAEVHEPKHITVIRYENRSNNPFYDLTILVKITTLDTTVDLSNLFTHNMYMAAHDSRRRNIITADELIKRGFDLNAPIETDQQVTLSLSYKFTFNKVVQVIKVQEYYWDRKLAKPDWAIK